MAAEFNAEPHVFGLDVTFDELGSRFLALRKVQWVNKGEEPDESKAKIELRKWMVDKEGAERANKGFSFLTEEGPHELARVLVHEGFGRTKDILNEIRVRDDFVEAVKTLNEDEESTEGEYFDIRSLIADEKDDSDVEDKANGFVDDFMNLPDGTYGNIEIKHF
jgi:hypothetical protein